MRIVALETREEISSSLEDIYFLEKRFSRKRERKREKVLFRSRNSLDFNWKQNVVEWIRETFLRKNNMPPSLLLLPTLLSEARAV